MEIDDIVKMRNSPEYFAESQLHLNQDTIAIMTKMNADRVVVYTDDRRNEGKTTAIVALALWKLVFGYNEKILIGTHMFLHASLILSKIAEMNESLPHEIQCKFIKNTKSELKTEHSCVLIQAVTRHFARGMMPSHIFIDEFGALSPKNKISLIENILPLRFSDISILSHEPNNIKDIVPNFNDVGGVFYG